MYTQVNRSWNRAKKVNYNGSIYDSGFEMGYAQELDFRQKAGEIIRWERQVKLPLNVNGFHICNYYIDFIAYYPDGIKEYIECKGFATAMWRMKWRLFEALMATEVGVRLLVVKQQNNFILRKMKRA